MFSPVYYAKVRAEVRGRIDVERGRFAISVSKSKEVGANFWGRNKPYAGGVLEVLARNTDVSEAEILSVVADAYIRYKIVKSGVLKRAAAKAVYP